MGSLLTIRLTQETHWVINGKKIANNVNTYIIANFEELRKKGNDIVFYDISSDKIYEPWWPSQTLKTTLSDQNYFDVFWRRIFKVTYLSSIPDRTENPIQANLFLNK